VARGGVSKRLLNSVKNLRTYSAVHSTQLQISSSYSARCSQSCAWKSCQLSHAVPTEVGLQSQWSKQSIHCWHHIQNTMRTKPKWGNFNTFLSLPLDIHNFYLQNLALFAPFSCSIWQKLLPAIHCRHHIQNTMRTKSKWGNFNTFLSLPLDIHTFNLQNLVFYAPFSCSIWQKLLPPIRQRCHYGGINPSAC
jgi:hypothetical protein